MASPLPKEFWTTDRGKNLLHAVECNNEIYLRALLDKDRPAIKKEMYLSNIAQLLKVAIDLKSSDIVSTLLHYGVSVKLPNYPYKQSALLYAVKARHEKIIMDMLQRGVDWKATDCKGRTALHLVIENEEHDKYDKIQWKQMSSRTQGVIIEICKMFLNKGMKVDVKNKYGETPLFLAIKHEMAKVAKYFITECNASLGVYNDKCDSLLHLLVQNEFDSDEKYNGNVKKLRQTRHENAKFMDSLLSKGLKIDCKNYNGETATQLAIEKNIIQLLPTLLKYTKNLNFPSKRNKTALHMILSRNNKENDHYPWSAKSEFWSIDESNNVVEMLLDKGASVDPVDSKGRTPFYLALEQKRYKIVLRMLKRFTNIQACDEHGNTVLHIAVKNYADEYSSELRTYKNSYVNIRTIRILLSKGADPTIKNQSGMAPIHLAAANNLFVILEMFKRHGTDFNLLTSNGESVLELMCKNKAKADFSHDAVKKLLKNYEWDVNATNKDGLTLLHLATISHNSGMVRLLIDYGANVNGKHKNTLLTPLHLASMVGVKWNLKNLQYTLESLLKPSKDFRNVSDDLIWKLVRSGANVYAKDSSGRTALHLATYRPCRMIRTLLDLGSREIDAQDNEGRTPLQNVLEYGNVEGLKTLLEFGVDINEVGSVSHLSDQKDINHGMSVRDYVLEHLVKLKALDLPIAKVYEPFLQMNESQWQTYEMECWLEVERLALFVVEVGVSLYDVIHMNSTRRYYYYTKNTNLVNLSFKLGFPMYHNILKSSKREALERKLMLEPAKQTLCKLVNYNLPDICTEHILSYLKISTLKTMVTVFK